MTQKERDEWNRVNYKYIVDPIWNHFQSDFPEENAIEDIIKVSIGAKKLKILGGKWAKSSFSPWQRVMSQIIAGDFFGARNCCA